MIVIGVGNQWRSDDAAGLEVARRLRSASPPGVEVVEAEGEPTALLEAWHGEPEAIVVDAVSSGEAPGTIHRLEPGEAPLPAEMFRGSTHALGIAEAVELARALERLPDRLRFYGIEGESFDAGEGLSGAVAEAVDELADELRLELEGHEAPR